MNLILGIESKVRVDIFLLTLDLGQASKNSSKFGHIFFTKMDVQEDNNFIVKLKINETIYYERDLSQRDLVKF